MTLLEEMEQYALEKDVPIMLQEGITFMCSFIKVQSDIPQFVWQC